MLKLSSNNSLHLLIIIIYDYVHIIKYNQNLLKGLNKNQNEIQTHIRKSIKALFMIEVENTSVKECGIV